MSNVFKAYDIRGVYPEELNKELAFKIGFATVKFLQAKSPNDKLNLVVGEDARISSPALRGAIIDAVTRAGANVKYIGLCTTPLFYFSVNKLKADGGIMVTASHNPPHYGGLKIVGYQSRPIGKESGLPEIEKLSETNIEAAKKEGTVEEVSFINDYVDTVISKSKIDPNKAGKIKFVMDAGNGMTPIVLASLVAKLKLNPVKIHFEIDGGFPNRSPDVSKEENLRDLKARVIETRSELGVAFDGDGDRIVFVDEKGARIDSGAILYLLFKNMSGFFIKPKVAYDLRFSRTIKEALSNSGFRSRPGSVFMKEFMIKKGLDLGGETSGHFFFRSFNYAESSSLVALMILKIVSESGKSISELVKPFVKYSHSGEINIEIRDKDQGLTVIQKLKEKYKDGQIDELDGVTVEYRDWWFNLRLSNTEPIVRLVVEGDTRDLMQTKVRELTAIINGSL